MGVGGRILFGLCLIVFQNNVEPRTLTGAGVILFSLRGLNRCRLLRVGQGLLFSGVLNVGGCLHCCLFLLRGLGYTAGGEVGLPHQRGDLLAV